MKEQITITDCSSNFFNDGVKKNDIIRNCCTGELHMIKQTKSGTTIVFRSTWQAVCVGIWLKLKLKVLIIFKGNNQ